MEEEKNNVLQPESDTTDEIKKDAEGDSFQPNPAPEPHSQPQGSIPHQPEETEEPENDEEDNNNGEDKKPAKEPDKPEEPKSNDTEEEKLCGNNTPPSNSNEVDWEGVKNQIDTYKETIEGKKCCCMIGHIILIAACLVMVGLITRAFICNCENILTNNRAGILLFGLFLLLILSAGMLIYHLVKSKKKYYSALNRLELLKTRIILKKDKTTYLIDIDRELQLIARILESTPNHDNYLNQ